MAIGSRQSDASLEARIQAVCDIMRRSNAASPMKYIPEFTWLLFLRVLDEQEEQEEVAKRIVGATFVPTIEFPYRWRDWAAPDGPKRQELQDAPPRSMLNFVKDELFPHLRSLGDYPVSTPRQRVVGEVISDRQEPEIDTEHNFLDILDGMHEIRDSEVDKTHTSPLSHAYESLLLKMGEKNNTDGQFFTPREVIRAIIKVVDPQVGETVFDPAAGTGGFLALAYEHMRDSLGDSITGLILRDLKERTFYGKEKDNQIYPICLANLVLHGVDEPHIWHGNTLTGSGNGGALWGDSPGLYDVAFMNPPFGGLEGSDARQRYAFKTNQTQFLFVQEVIDSLRTNGRAGIVVDEGFLSRTHEKAFIQTKQKLLDECDVYCVVSLPSGVFTKAGTSVKTSLMFFNKGNPTEQTWYYDLTDLKVTKTQPLLLSRFDEFFELLPERVESERSWTVTREEIATKKYDLSAANPNRRVAEDTRTPEELIDEIESANDEIRDAIAKLRELDSTSRT